MHARCANRILLAVFVVFGWTPTAIAEPTDITVRAISRDAKFIGSSMGGVEVTLRDADTGELLAKGRIEGGTGDTKRIMAKERKRGEPLSTDDAAYYSVTLDLDAPRRIEASAFGPLAKRNGANRVSATQWVVPGKHLTGGDGWVLEMPGFVVETMEPALDKRSIKAGKTIDLRAHVTMMCGCPIEPGGLWDANRYEVRARIKRDGGPAEETALSYAGKTNQFVGAFKAGAPGLYEIAIYAYDSATGNTGLDTVIVTVRGD